MAEALFEVKDLRVHFNTPDGVVKAVDGLSFTVERGETFGIVGESGSGKSVTCLTALGLTNRKAADITGEVLFQGKNLLELPPSELRKIRGKDLAMIFQDPFACLHPFYRVGDQIVEAVQAHEDVSKEKARERVVELLAAVGIPKPKERFRDYPHQYSGGMRQRAMIAMALVHNPDILIADEPTTALDVTVQAQILDLIDRVKKDFNIGVILITHDLGVVADVAAEGHGHVRRTRDGARDEGRGLPATPAPLRVGPPRVDSDGDPEGDATDPDRRRAALPHQRPAGLSVPPALPAPVRAVRQGDSAAQGPGRRASGGVSPLDRGKAAALDDPRVRERGRVSVSRLRLVPWGNHVSPEPPS